MQVSFKKTIGNSDFVINLDAQNDKEVFERVNFWSSLPEKGPNGEEDLILSVRKVKTQEGKTAKYYSILCPSAKQEYTIGQNAEGDTLFGKRWEDQYNANGDQGGSVQSSFTGGQPQSAPQQAQAQPVQQQQAQSQPAHTAGAVAVSNPVAQPQVSTQPQVAQPVQQAQPQPQQAATNPVQAQAQPVQNPQPVQQPTQNQQPVQQVGQSDSSNLLDNWLGQ